MSELEGTKAVVVGASRGFGRGIVEALVEAGAEVYALSRGDSSEVVRVTGGRAHAIRADAAHPETPSRILGEIAPTVVVLNAGATPQIAPFREQTWDAFSTNWNADVKIVFQWLKAIVDQPLADGSSVVTLSSGAALRGSPLSGGYAGAKAMVAFLTEYVAQDVARMKLRIRFATLLPMISPEGGVGRQAVEAYARRQGRTVEQFLGGPPLTPADVGGAVVRLLRDRSLDGQIAFRLDRGGLTPLKQGA